MAETRCASGFTVTALPASRTFRVQSYGPEPDVSRLSDAIETAWPRVVGAVAEGRFRVLCIGPLDWVVVALDAHEQTQDALESAARAAGFSVLDVSDALPAIRLSGGEVRDVLSQGCGVDLHPGALAAGQCVRTRLAQVSVILHCAGDESTFDCYVSRSYGAHFTAWLAGATA